MTQEVHSEKPLDTLMELWYISGGQSENGHPRKQKMNPLEAATSKGFSLI